jgi:hypothetical protein
MKIISGGQTGADEAGLVAAKAVGLQTGGWMPKGCLTESGPKREFLELYSMNEYAGNYIGRTYANVKNSDGTIRFATNFHSAGEVVTLDAIKKYDKPWIDVDFGFSGTTTPVDVVKWIEENNIVVLNVAGNRESKSPGMFQKTTEFLMEVFRLLNDNG